MTAAELIREYGYLGLAVDVSDLDEADRASVLERVEAALGVPVRDQDAVLTGQGLYCTWGDGVSAPWRFDDEEVHEAADEIEAAWEHAVSTLA